MRKCATQPRYARHRSGDGRFELSRRIVPQGKNARDCPKRLNAVYDPEFGKPNLGDVFLSLERVRQQAKEYGHSITREAVFLATHASLHLLGYDHMEEEERQKMRAMEEAAMEQLGIDRNPLDEHLFLRACEALENAYAPYSGYKVGACLLCEDGREFLGCNIENASYGATICAERAAISTAVSQGARRFTAIAIVGEKGDSWPCGICRQVLNEFSVDMRVIVGQKGGAFDVVPLGELCRLFWSAGFGTTRRNQMGEFHSGFVAILGRPNVGKSSLMNRFPRGKRSQLFRNGHRPPATAFWAWPLGRAGKLCLWIRLACTSRAIAWENS